MDYKRDQHKSCRRVRVAQRIAVANAVLAYILWKFGGKELIDLHTLTCM